MEKRDIKDKTDLMTLVDLFYDNVKANELLAPMFDHVDWVKHLPVMYSFWDNVLFHTGGYAGNPMAKHQSVHQKHPLSHHHFEQWIELFIETVEMTFTGPNTETLKDRAKNIALIMELKILGQSSIKIQGL
jgi:hemoglobin